MVSVQLLVGAKRPNNVCVCVILIILPLLRRTYATRRFARISEESLDAATPASRAIPSHQLNYTPF